MTDSFGLGYDDFPPDMFDLFGKDPFSEEPLGEEFSDESDNEKNEDIYSNIYDY